MTVSISITGLDSFIGEELRAAKQAGQAAMAEKFFEITRENFGETGIDRPVEWPLLTWQYAIRVNRKHATLFLSGELEKSIQWNDSNSEFSEVWTDNEYADIHQFGGGNNNPPRPFMPLINGPDAENVQLTPMADEQILKAAQDAIAQRMK